MSPIHSPQFLAWLKEKQRKRKENKLKQIKEKQKRIQEDLNLLKNNYFKRWKYKTNPKKRKQWKKIAKIFRHYARDDPPISLRKWFFEKVRPRQCYFKPIK